MTSTARRDLLMVPPEDIVYDADANYADAKRGDTAGLRASILANGIHNPLRCQRLPDGRLKLNSGFRRLRLVNEINAEAPGTIVRVPVLLTDRFANEPDLLIDQMLENAFRTDADPLDEAKAFNALFHHGMEVKEIAERLGHTVSYIQGRLSLLSTTPAIQKAVKNKELGVTAAQSIAKASADPQRQEEILQRTKAKGSTNRAAREATRTKTYRTTRGIRETEAAQRHIQRIIDKGAYRTSDELEPAVFHAYAKMIEWFLGGLAPWGDAE